MTLTMVAYCNERGVFFLLLTRKKLVNIDKCTIGNVNFPQRATMCLETTHRHNLHLLSVRDANYHDNHFPRARLQARRILQPNSLMGLRLMVQCKCALLGLGKQQDQYWKSSILSCNVREFQRDEAKRLNWHHFGQPY